MHASYTAAAVLVLCSVGVVQAGLLDWVPGLKSVSEVYQDGERMAIVQLENGKIKHCELYGNNSGIVTEVMGIIIRMKNFAYNMVTLNKEKMQTVIEDCVQVLAVEKPKAIAEAVSPQAIVPGTKWCGAGNIAKDYNDLGVLASTDMCCRTHDHCPDNIPKGETKYGITNGESGTMSNCDCDDEFRQCLKNVSSNDADTVGHVFFNVLAMQCFREDYPVVQCSDFNAPLTRTWYSAVSPVSWFRYLRRTCNIYRKDESKPKVYQTFDSKQYKSSIGLI